MSLQSKFTTNLNKFTPEFFTLNAYLSFSMKFIIYSGGLFLAVWQIWEAHSGEIVSSS